MKDLHEKLTKFINQQKAYNPIKRRLEIGDIYNSINDLLLKRFMTGFITGVAICLICQLILVNL